MKKSIKSTFAIFLSLLCIICLASCNTTEAEDIWESATYKEDTAFGEGARTAVVEVKVGEHTATFTINTDKDTVGEALFEHGLISGDEGEYGLYIKSVNGMRADYDVDQHYWAFYINGEYAMSGVDTTEIIEGEVYQLVYTK